MCAPVTATHVRTYSNELEQALRGGRAVRLQPFHCRSGCSSHPIRNQSGLGRLEQVVKQSGDACVDVVPDLTDVGQRTGCRGLRADPSRRAAVPVRQRAASASVRTTRSADAIARGVSGLGWSMRRSVTDLRPWRRERPARMRAEVGSMPWPIRRAGGGSACSQAASDHQRHGHLRATRVVVTEEQNPSGASARAAGRYLAMPSELGAAAMLFAPSLGRKSPDTGRCGTGPGSDSGHLTARRSPGRATPSNRWVSDCPQIRSSKRSSLVMAVPSASHANSAS